ncbi:MAG: polar growth protein [Bathelium mastoideum]|nr:MAG: polar growth protein [Bathelium mastoideum]
MATRQPNHAQPGDILLVVRKSQSCCTPKPNAAAISGSADQPQRLTDDFSARSADELSLSKGDRVELIERDDDFGDGWFLGRHLTNQYTGLFPEVYTTPAPRGALSNAAHQRRVNESQAKVGANIPNQSFPPTTSQIPSDQSAQSGNNSLPAAIDPATIPHSTTTVVRSASSPLVQSSSARVTPPMSARTGAVAAEGNMDNPVMNETLSVINEHITDMHTPRHSMLRENRRPNNDSGSEYSTNVGPRLSYINGHETDEEESGVHSEAEVSKWTPERVAEYLEDVGVERTHCDVFREQEISGEVLLGMDQPSIFIKEFDLGPVGRRLRTWQKIKALQEEVRGNSKRSRSVSEYSGGEEASQDSATRNRSTTVGATLPRIPSISERPVSRTQSTHTASTTSLAASTPFGLPVPTPPVQEALPRPSAASVRQMNHSRRHSSIDSTKTPVKTVLPETSLSASPTRTQHRKIPSFDKNWGGLASPPTAQSGRPASSAHAHSLSTDGTQFDAPTSNYNAVAPFDLEKGYFSGGEVEMRSGKNNRNVLRKNQSATHSRDSSYDARRRSEAPRPHMRAGSTESIQAFGASPLSPAAQYYYGKVNRPQRAASGPDFSTPSVTAARDLPPTVTKLEFTQSPSMDAIANSPAIGSGPGSESSSVMTPSPAQFQHSFWSKPRVTGIRTISDAITGDEKARVEVEKPPVSPVKESPVSPARTGSTTPSGTSLDASELPANRQSTINSLTSTTSSSRRRSKKTTSAYTRGLIKKSPQEQMLDCDYSGWMKKKSSNLMTTWKPRLFVLKGRRLSYYYSENDKEEKGLIDISSHRVLPADTERLTGLHATITGATTSPTSPQNSQTPTAASIDAEKAAAAASASTSPNPGNTTTISATNSPTTNDPAKSAAATTKDSSGIFIFKLVPPRSGLSKAVNFTKPTVHYFAVDSVQQGRLWMAALMKATIDRDESQRVVTTYAQKTISLTKARAMKHRPPALMEAPPPLPSADERRWAAGGLMSEEQREPVSPIEEVEAGEEKEGEAGLKIRGLRGSGEVDGTNEQARAGDEDSGVAGVEKAPGGEVSFEANGVPHLPTPQSGEALSNGFFPGSAEGQANAVAGAEQAVGS